MLNVRLAGDNLYGKWLFTWLSLVMSLMVSFCAVPLIVSVPEDFKKNPLKTVKGVVYTI